MGNSALILDRSIESISIDGGAALAVDLVKGNVKLASSDASYTLSNGMDKQKGSNVDFTIKLVEQLASGDARDMAYSKLESGPSGAAGIEPVTYVDNGFINKGKLQIVAVPTWQEDAGYQKLLMGKDISLTADTLETAAASLTAIEGQKAKLLWYKLTTVIADVFKLKNTRMTYKVDYEFSQGDTSVISLTAKKHVLKILDALSVPANLTLLATLEALEGAPHDIALTGVDGNIHTLTDVIFGVGITFDFTSDGVPTIDLIGSKHVVEVGDVYSIA